MVAAHRFASIFAFSVIAGVASAQTAPPPARIPADSPLQSPVEPPPTPKELTLEMRGDIFMARKMYREAVEVYQQRAAELKKQYDDLRKQADALRKQKKPKEEAAARKIEAEELRKKAEASKPQMAIMANKIGIAYHQMTQLDTARKYYEDAVKLNSRYAEAINNLGTVHYAKKSYGRAVGQYKKALKYTPNSASIYSNLGTAHFARKRYKDAFEAYQQALSLDPEVFEHRSTQGVLLQERSVEERAKFHFYLAKVYAKAGMVDRVLMYMRKALEEGFKEREKFKEDPEFAALQEHPEFQQLLAMEPRVL